jgi:Recombination endonuclease VII
MAGITRKQPLPDRDCVTCGKTFSPYRHYTVTCSRACRDAAHRAGLIPREERIAEFICARCERPSSRSVSRLGARPSYCVDCKPLADREMYERKNEARRRDAEANPENYRRRNRTANLRRYGLTIEQHDAMFAEQGGVCAICKRPADPNGVRAASRLHVDHDHVTGQVRALLCLTCNQGIGSFRDDPTLLHAAAVYVWKWRGVT